MPVAYKNELYDLGDKFRRTTKDFASNVLNTIEKDVSGLERERHSQRLLPQTQFTGRIS